MADVTKIERVILGLEITNSAADADGDGQTDMRDLIKVERKILGLDQ